MYCSLLAAGARFYSSAAAILPGKRCGHEDPAQPSSGGMLGQILCCRNCILKAFCTKPWKDRVTQRWRRRVLCEGEFLFLLWLRMPCPCQTRLALLHPEVWALECGLTRTPRVSCSADVSASGVLSEGFRFRLGLR